MHTICSTLIICEIGVNHNGDVALAEKMIDEAAACGADIVKFQTFKTEDVLTRNAPKAEYQKQNTGGGDTQFEMIKALELSPAEFTHLKAYSENAGVEFLSTPFSIAALNLLLEIGVKRIKIPSGEIINGPLLLEAARSGLPVILSTGMADMQEIKTALSILAFGYTQDNQAVPSPHAFEAAYNAAEGQEALRKCVTVLQCTTQYPAPPESVNLRAMQQIRETTGLETGFSDHTQGIHIPVAAVAMGACIIEKHFTLDNAMDGPDHKASLEPDAFKEMVRAIRDVEKALGSGEKTPFDCEIAIKSVARQSLVAAQPIEKGEVFTSENITTKRAGGGISPMHYWELLGQIAHKAYSADDVITNKHHQADE